MKQINGIELLDIISINEDIQLKLKHTECGNIFTKKPNELFNKGERCPKCAFKLSNKQIISKLKEREDNEEYEILDRFMKDKITYLLVKHNCGNKYEVSQSNFLNNKSKCALCVHKESIESINNRANNKINSDEYEIIERFMDNNKSKLKIKHKICGRIFERFADAFLNKDSRCDCCSISILELELFEFIKENYKGKIIQSDRMVLKPKELDIYLPELKLAFEFDGLYWHSEGNKNNNYHLDKTNNCEKQNIQLIHIFEDEWVNKKDIVKSRILNLLQSNSNKVYARKCKVKKISSEYSKKFLIENHIQGNCPASIRYGLFYKDELVSVLTFSKLRNSMSSKKDNASHELLRFANKKNTSIVGGFSKLLKNVMQLEKNITRIKTFADRRWSTGKVYELNGFEFSHNSKPNYSYIKGNMRESRIKYQKHKLGNILQEFDIKKTEIENMKDNGYKRIFDCGNKVYYIDSTTDTK